MSKPLELTWYEQDEVGDYIHPADYAIDSVDVDYWMECKRLTDAELAAEVWHCITNYYTLEPSPEAREEASRSRTIERFATLPHHDEAPE